MPGLSAFFASPLRRRIVAIGAVAGVVFLLSLGEHLFLSAARGSWRAMRGEVDSTLAASVEEAFAGNVRDLHALARRIDTIGAVRAALVDGGGDALRGATETLAALSRQDATVELFDTAGALVGATGRPLPPPDTASHFTERIRLVSLGVTTFLLAEHAFPARGRHALVRVAFPFSVQRPINNRFFSARGIQEELEREFGIALDVETDRRSPGMLDGRLLSIPLVADGDTLAAALTPRTSLGMYLLQLSKKFSAVRTAVLAVLIALCMATVWSVCGRFRRPGMRAAARIATLWSARIVLLATGFGGGLLPASLSNPAVYASSFAFGLASSPLELFLSLAAAAASVSLLVRLPAGPPAGRYVRAVSLVALPAALPPLLRGLAAAFRSLVLDSSVNFDDLPALAARTPYLFLFASAFLLAGSFAWAVVRVLARVSRDASTVSPGREWMRTLPALCAAASALVLHAVTRETLLPWWVYGAVPILLGYAVVPSARGPLAAFSSPGIRWAVLWLGAAGISAWLLHGFMGEKRRQDLEAIGAGLARPVDAWTTVLVQQALARMSGSAVPVPAGSEQHRRPDVTAGFSLWAESPLSSEPNNAAVFVFDTTGVLLSRFSVGLDPSIAAPAVRRFVLPVAPDRVVRFSARADVSRRAWYGAYTAAQCAPGVPCRVAVVVEPLDPVHAAGIETDLLRNTTVPRSIAPEDRIRVCAFRDARLVQSSDPDIGTRATLPAGVFDSVRTGRDPGSWSAVCDNAVDHPAYLVHAGRDTSTVLALLPGDPDPLVSAYRLLRIVALCFVFSLVPGAPAFVAAVRRRRGRALRFARVLQIAFFTVALVPVLLGWLTARGFIIDNARRVVEGDLSDRLAAVHDLLLAAVDTVRTDRIRAVINDSVCFAVSRAVRTPVNVHMGYRLIGTSLPELYATGLLNPRPQPETVENAVLRGRTFTAVEERIGEATYTVGTRTIRDAHGAVIATISTPTLFEFVRTEREYIRASAIVLLVTAGIAVLVAALAGAFSRRISRPIKALTDATRALAVSDPGGPVAERGPAEVRELAASFNAMTDDLRRSRTELAAAERELAWKEMAKQVAHEIRNPLTPIRLAAQHLDRAARDGAADLAALVSRLTRTIVEQIDALARISGEFASFARMPSRTIEDIDLPAALEETVALFRQHDRIAVSLRVDAPLPAVRGDRAEFARALQNLLRNAIQSIHDEGTVEVDAVRYGDAVRVAIRDTGCGIPPDLLPRIFEPNFSTKTEGMGLGLAIVKKIVDDMHGTIAIESAVDRGTTVTMEFPEAGKERTALRYP